jgi:hypothetical protein
LTVALRANARIFRVLAQNGRQKNVGLHKKNGVWYKMGYPVL